MLQKVMTYSFRQTAAVTTLPLVTYNTKIWRHFRTSKAALKTPTKRSAESSTGTNFYKLFLLLLIHNFTWLDRYDFAPVKRDTFKNC